MLSLRSLVQRGLTITGVLVVIVFSSMLYQWQTKISAQALLTVEATEPVERITISDDYYGYNFQIPATWYSEMDVTPEHWYFLSDPDTAPAESSKHLHPEALPGGLITARFAVDPVPNLLPEPEVRDPLVDEVGNATREVLIPLLPSGTWITVAGLPALRVEHSAEELAEGDGGPYARGTSVYILSERLVYFLAFAYIQPSESDDEQMERDYEQTITDILDSFVIDLEAQAARPPGSLPASEE